MKFTDDINKNFVVKWSKALTDSNNAVTSGVFHAPAEEFITKIEDEAQFIKMVRYVEMEVKKLTLNNYVFTLDYRTCKNCHPAKF